MTDILDSCLCICGNPITRDNVLNHCSCVTDHEIKIKEEMDKLREIALDNIYLSVAIETIGMYPQSVIGKNGYKKRSEAQEAHNKCLMRITSNACTIEKYVNSNEYKEDIEKALLDERIDVMVNGKDHEIVKFFVNCNDVFVWGLSESELIEPKEIKDLYACYNETEQFGDMLWACRKRNMRPQKPWFKDMNQNEKKLFEACGPERKE